MRRVDQTSSRWYHGTSQERAAAIHSVGFDPALAAASHDFGDLGLGVYFTRSAERARLYGLAIIKVTLHGNFAHIREPYFVHAGQEFLPETPEEHLFYSAAFSPHGEMLTVCGSPDSRAEAACRVRDVFLAHGFDGIISNDPDEAVAFSKGAIMVENPLPEDWEEEIERMLAQLERAKALLREHKLVAVGEAPNDVFFLLHPSTTIPMGWQVSYFDRRGPFGHTEHESLDVVLREAFDTFPGRGSLRPVTEKEFMAIHSTPEWDEGSKRCEFVSLDNRLRYEFGYTPEVMQYCADARNARDIDEAIDILTVGLRTLRRRAKENPYTKTEERSVLVSSAHGRERRCRSFDPWVTMTGRWRVR